jgi:hypothetical protein
MNPELENRSKVLVASAQGSITEDYFVTNDPPPNLEDSRKALQEFLVFQIQGNRNVVLVTVGTIQIDFDPLVAWSLSRINFDISRITTLHS